MRLAETLVMFLEVSVTRCAHDTLASLATSRNMPNVPANLIPTLAPVAIPGHHRRCQTLWEIQKHQQSEIEAYQ